MSSAENTIVLIRYGKHCEIFFLRYNPLTKMNDNTRLMNDKYPEGTDRWFSLAFKPGKITAFHKLVT